MQTVLRPLPVYITHHPLLWNVIKIFCHRSHSQRELTKYMKGNNAKDIHKKGNKYNPN